MSTHENTRPMSPALLAMAALVISPLKVPDWSQATQREIIINEELRREKHNRLPHQGKREQARRAKQLLKIQKRALK